MCFEHLLTTIPWREPLQPGWLKGKHDAVPSRRAPATGRLQLAENGKCDAVPKGRQTNRIPNIATFLAKFCFSADRVILSSSSLVVVEVWQKPLESFWHLFWHSFWVWHLFWHSFRLDILCRVPYISAILSGHRGPALPRSMDEDRRCPLRPQDDWLRYVAAWEQNWRN